MTEPVFLSDAYQRRAAARVMALTEDGGVVLDRSLFYPTGGGQPGDCGRLVWDGGKAVVLTTRKGDAGDIVLVSPEGAEMPPIGCEVLQQIDWDRRHRHMRVHTALHLLSVVIPLPVTGGQITAEKGRLDFDMPDAPEDPGALQSALDMLIARDLAVTSSWITDAELEARPDLVKTMSVRPPKGAGQVRLIRIGDSDEAVDLQPCGGTHVQSTAEIGRVSIGKIEKKGRRNRRVHLHLG